MLTAAIWIFALGFFFLFGFTSGFRFSWLAFIFALGLQMLVQSLFALRGNKEKR
jgi:hypothetical protein